MPAGGVLGSTVGQETGCFSYFHCLTPAQTTGPPEPAALQINTKSGHNLEETQT